MVMHWTTFDICTDNGPEYNRIRCVGKVNMIQVTVSPWATAPHR